MRNKVNGKTWKDLVRKLLFLGKLDVALKIWIYSA